MPIKTIFLDRDGVINKEIDYLFKIKDFEFIEGIFEACIYFQELGYNLVIVTNQSGIHRGFYDEGAYRSLTKWMLGQFKKNKIDILDVFHCSHGENSSCECRKPKPGMLLKAQKKHKIIMEESWLIGDKEGDIKAANNAGIENTILVRSGHKIDEAKSNAKYILNSIHDAKNKILQ
jgi:D-glycero-D-manno-heptose 1,7-bisphosphate phosphatase